MFLYIIYIPSTFPHLKIKTTITREVYFCVSGILTNKNLFKDQVIVG